ncbi:MAG: hypothetical protein ACLT5P_04370 [Flavonifractor plautii]
MGTDRYAYQSRLRRISPMPKLLLTGSALVLCLLCDSVTVGLVTLLGMWGWLPPWADSAPRLPALSVHPDGLPGRRMRDDPDQQLPPGAPVLLAVPVGSGCGALTGRRCSGPGGCSARHWGRWEPCTSWR